MNRFFILATCVTLVLSMLCGCDSKNAGSTSSTIIEPAAIISKEDAKALTGVNFGDCTVKEKPVVGLKLCVYEKDGAFLQLGLTQAAFMDKRNVNTPESIYKSLKSGFSGAAKLDGVGDDNFVAPPGLHIMRDGYYMTVSLGLMNGSREKLRAVGMKAVENLDKYARK